MDRVKISQQLGVESINEYIFREYYEGKKDAEESVEKSINETLKLIEGIGFDEAKVLLILKFFIQLKAAFNQCNDLIQQLKVDSKEIFSKGIRIINNEDDEIKILSEYIIDFYQFKGYSDFKVLRELKQFRDKSFLHNSIIAYKAKSNLLFAILDKAYNINDFSWSWSNFEIGLIEILKNIAIDKNNLISDFEYKIEKVELNKNNKIDNLKYEISSLERKIESLEYKAELTKEVFDKYYYGQTFLTSNTYFGDNQPFLYNLFVFLWKNSLFSYGWSYFYNCTKEGSNEIIPLECKRKLNIIGRVLYNLQDFLNVELRSDSFKFFQSKFFINEKPIGDNFKANHMKTKYDPKDEPFLVLIDEFFEKQKKIYLKI